MTELLSRPSRTPRTAGRPGRVAGSRHRPADVPPATTRSLTAAGIVAAVRSAGLGILAVMVVVLVAWASAADSGADATDAVATALMAWLVGHHAHLAVPGGELALVPLGLTALPIALLHAATLRAGRAAGVRGKTAVLALASSTTATYAVLATFVALLARTGEVQALPVSAFVGAAGVAALGSGTGAIRATGTWSGVSRRLHPLVRAALPAATGALAVLLAGGALVTGAALAVHRDRAALLVDGLGAGLGGGVLLGRALPAVRPDGGVLGHGVRRRAGLRRRRRHLGVAVRRRPRRRPRRCRCWPRSRRSRAPAGHRWCCSSRWVAGVLAGVLAHRCGAVADEGWRPLAEVSAVAGGLVAAAVAVLALLASGPGGPGRLAETGPDWWSVAPVAGLEVAVVMAAALLVLRRRA